MILISSKLGGDVTLSADETTISNSVEVVDDLTINLNGKKLTYGGNNWLFNVYNDGLDGNTQGSVVFKNNVATNKACYSMQMSSSNYNYKKINYDVQGNSNFSVDGTTFLARVDGTLDFSGTTFSTGSETFKF